MTLDITMLVASLAIILAASVGFTNAIEMLGHRLKVHQGAVGSVLAAVGTALPETVIPVIAILDATFRGNGEAGKTAYTQITIGAIAGAPFMLATLAFFVTGVAVVIYSAMGKRTRVMNIDPKVLSRDLRYFVVIYGLAVATTFLPMAGLDHVSARVVRGVVAVILLLSYGLYLRSTFKSDAAQVEDVEELLLAKLLPRSMRARWPLFLTVLQVLLALGVMLYGAELFVEYTKDVARMFDISPLVLTLIIAPIATELPEKCNSVIWVGKKKDILALGNITGAMVFQSCFPVVFGMLFTDWNLLADHAITLVTAVLAFISAALVLGHVHFARWLRPIVLMAGGVLYAAFIAYFCIFFVMH